MRGKAGIDPDGKFIRAQFDEDATIADWIECRALVMSLVQGSGIRLALVDIRKQKASAPTLELFRFGRDVPTDVRFAILARRNSDDSFVETVARNRGAMTRLFFGPEDEAIEWLSGRK